MEKLNYQIIKGHKYAKYPGTSCWKGHLHGPRKEGALYLGVEIDGSQNLFFHQERGLFIYDALNGKCRKTKKFSFPGCPLLTFGDSYFLDKFLKEKIRYKTVLDQIFLHNRDTLYAMIHYYILCDDVNIKAEDWFKGSFASFLYPKAKLSDGDVEKFLTSLGQQKRVETFSDAHIRWGDFIYGDGMVLMGRDASSSGTGGPDGSTGHDVGVMALIQQSTGYPVLLYNVSDDKNYLDIISEVKYKLSCLRMELSHIIIHADCKKKENWDTLYEKKIPFIVRVSPGKKTYEKVVDSGECKLKDKKNLVQYGGRKAYVYRAKYRAEGVYAYLCCFSDDADQDTALGKDEHNQAGSDDTSGNPDNEKRFVLISTKSFKKREILPAYYLEELFHQYFDINSGNSKFSLMGGRYEGEALYGHLILSMIAATINQYIKNKFRKSWEEVSAEDADGKGPGRKDLSAEEIFRKLREQKCAKVNSLIINTEVQDDVLELFKKFGIDFPLYLKYSRSNLKPYFLKDEESRIDP